MEDLPEAPRKKNLVGQALIALQLEIVDHVQSLINDSTFDLQFRMCIWKSKDLRAQ